MKHTWMIVKPNEEGRPVQIEEGDHKEMERLLTKGGIDWASLSRHFHVAVYEWSITEQWPLNWQYRRGVSGYSLHGPVLIYKTNEIGETIDMTPQDIENLRDWIAAARMGLIFDSADLDRDA